MKRNSKLYFRNLLTLTVSDGVNQIRFDNRIYKRTRIKGKVSNLYRVVGIRIENRSRLRIPDYLIGTVVPLYRDGSRVYYEVAVKYFKKKKRVYLNKDALEAINEYTNGRL